jgi:hypothetical protein
MHLALPATRNASLPSLWIAVMAFVIDVAHALFYIQVSASEYYHLALDILDGDAESLMQLVSLTA